MSEQEHRGPRGLGRTLGRHAYPWSDLSRRAFAVWPKNIPICQTSVHTRVLHSSCPSPQEFSEDQERNRSAVPTGSERRSVPRASRRNAAAALIVAVQGKLDLLTVQALAEVLNSSSTRAPSPASHRARPAGRDVHGPPPDDELVRRNELTRITRAEHADHAEHLPTIGSCT